ncbi:MAG: hypothetical protein IPL01_13910 [Acidobacteria bacterium]|nr:hypothetical protein [Acidobacteriota bacterium]
MLNAVEKQKLLIHPQKSGFTWALDRTTGKYINAWKHIDAINWVKGFDKDGQHIGRLGIAGRQEHDGLPSWEAAVAGIDSSFSPRTGWLYNHGIEWCTLVTPMPQNPKEGQEFPSPRQPSPSLPNGEYSTHH